MLVYYIASLYINTSFTFLVFDMNKEQWDQSKFDKHFIGTKEIADFLNTPTITIWTAMKAGRFPKGIKVVTNLVWDRELVMPILQDWKVSLNKKRRIN